MFPFGNMASSLIVLGALVLSAVHSNSFIGSNDSYYDFPKFWTSCGLCPDGDLTHKDIKKSLLSDAMQMNILLISSLPRGAITHLRIHWLLELLEFVQFTQSGLPIFDFTDLDEFLMNLNDMDLYPVVEFMGNLSDIFQKNPTNNDVIWEDLSYQLTHRYLNMFGVKTVSKWRFETWNEPDLLMYNKLNFTLKDLLIYTTSIKYGLKRGGKRSEHNLHIPLRGPAGLFKSLNHHPLCWGILKYCNANITQCPIDIISYHRKGNGTDALVIVDDSERLFADIFRLNPSLRSLPISNSEADPIARWSVPRDFQEDVRYAITLVNIVLTHWEAKLTGKSLSNLESISHDNAFLSYHPYEFSQRTLLAHFRINNTFPQHSQFIQKPVYAALGILSRLADKATGIQKLKTTEGLIFKALMTENAESPIYLCWLIMPFDEEKWKNHNEVGHGSIMLNNIPLNNEQVLAYILESVDQNNVNPAKIWRAFDRPAYPNATIREEMRRHHTPHILSMGTVKNLEIKVDLSKLAAPWFLLLRICSNEGERLEKPQKLEITPVTHNEVQLTWRELHPASSNCLRTYEIWFRSNITQKWSHLTDGWHVPFPSFQYAPLDGTRVNGFYKVRGIDVFNNTGGFSVQTQYIEL